MFSEVVSQVAALLEDSFAAGILALEVEFHTLRSQIFNLDCFVPIFWNVSKCLRLNSRHFCVRGKLRLVAKVDLLLILRRFIFLFMIHQSVICGWFGNWHVKIGPSYLERLFTVLIGHRIFNLVFNIFREKTL